MKFRFVTIFLLLFSVTCAYAQKWETIKANTRAYICGEGFGETLDEADKQALAQIISKISVEVSNNYEQLEGEKIGADSTEYKRYVQNKISTFSTATLTNTESIVLSNEPNAHVARWVKRSEIDKIFQGRKTKILEYVANAVKAESKGKIDDALKYYYWAYTLLKTLQHPSELVYTDGAGSQHVLVTWIPEVMDEIFDDLKPSIIKKSKNDLNIYFTYKGEPVVSLDYTYFDGSRWSNIYSAKDGVGVLELAPGSPTENIQIKYEYVHSGEAHIDKELYNVMNVVKGNSLKGAYVTLKCKVEKKVAGEVAKEEKMNIQKTTESLARVDGEKDVRGRMNRIVEAIKTRKYSGIEDCFTVDGFEMWNKLISYGNAALVGTPVFSLYENGNKVVARSVRMSFSFKYGVRKSFVEDIVFTFNKDGKVESLAFALDDKAAQDILNQTAWPLTARVSIVEFLENYKTAFALKRLDYIRTIFDDDAVIIVGSIARVATPVMKDGVTVPSSSENRIVKRTRYSKEQYLRNLARCFASNEFVNIRFANNDVIKAGKGGELYGIQIKQDYYSSNYGDTGYLFLMVDINNPQEPLIKVRTWQPEPDPVDGLYDISFF